MSLQDPFSTIDYQHPDWAKDSFITFRRHKTRGDTEAMVEKTSETIRNFDVKAMRDAQRRGDEYIPEFDIKTRASALITLITHMGAAWRGSEFTLPKEFHTADGKIDPRAGQLPPFDAYYVGLLPEPQLEDVERYLNKLYAGRTEDQQKRFRESNRDASDPESAAE